MNSPHTLRRGKRISRAPPPNARRARAAGRRWRPPGPPPAMNTSTFTRREKMRERPRHPLLQPPDARRPDGGQLFAGEPGAHARHRVVARDLVRAQHPPSCSPAARCARGAARRRRESGARSAASAARRSARRRRGGAGTGCRRWRRAAGPIAAGNRARRARRSCRPKWLPRTRQDGVLHFVHQRAVPAAEVRDAHALAPMRLKGVGDVPRVAHQRVYAPQVATRMLGPRVRTPAGYQATLFP